MLHLKHRHRHHKKRPNYTALDFLAYTTSFGGPIMTLPQVYDIWVRKVFSVNGFTWGFYLITSIIWLFYGVKHNDKLIAVSSVLWMVVQGFVVVGLLLFR